MKPNPAVATSVEAKFTTLGLWTRRCVMSVVKRATSSDGCYLIVASRGVLHTDTKYSGGQTLSFCIPAH